jgi:dipeptidyl-peptidase-4
MDDGSVKRLHTSKATQDGAAMKRFTARGIALAFAWLVSLLLVSTTVPAKATSPGGKPLDLDTIFDSATFRAQLPRALQWLPGGDSYAYVEAEPSGEAIVRRSAVDASLLSTVDMSSIAGLPDEFTLSDFRWHPQSGAVLLRGALSSDWMGYQRAVWYSYNTKTKRVLALGSPGQLQQLVKLSPDGLHAGYVRDNNIYLVELSTGKRIAVTADGNEDIFNGVFDYGSSEFGPVDGWRWSPTGKHVAFWRMDAAGVRYYPLIDELHSYPQVRQFHYPNTSEAHAINEVRVFSIETGESTVLPIGQDPDDYLPQLHWNAAGDAVYVQHLTRDHQTLRLWLAPADGGATQLVLAESDPAWIDIGNDLRSLRDGSLLWTSEKSGFRHIYKVASDGRQRSLTDGNWSVDAIVGVDAAEEWVYFYAKKDSLIDQRVYRVHLQDRRLERLTEKSGWHLWDLSPDGAAVLATHSDANTPQSLSLRAASGELIQSIVSESLPALADYGISPTEFVTFTTDDGIELNAFMIKPPDFDPSKRYPVIAYGYGNAGSQVVVNRWGTQRGPTQDLWHRYLAQQGYVVFAMDNRTTAGRGKAAKNLTYGEYGKYAVLDYIQGVDYLKSLPWIDSERIGFWGWSGGGYLAAALMTKAAPLFKVAVSVAPVIDLRHYQAVGVERWMGRPETNPNGYAAVNLENYADRLQGKLLLIHGTGDENVKFAFTLQFADALIRANKQFDMLVYPNQRHGIADSRLHVFSTMTRYFRENL